MKKSILVGDIGSTKSTWWYNSDHNHVIQLEGYNPLAHPVQSGMRMLETLRIQTATLDFTDIWYYGTGVIDQQVSTKVTELLRTLFKTGRIHVASDLVGAATTACGNEPGSVAILGTGSHVAVFDGKKIVRQATSLGYILGDEGGGCDIGKALLQSYFYHELPEPLTQEMATLLPSGREGFLNGLQSSSSPNQYLAEFARVAVLFQDHPWIKEMVCSRFRLFVKRHVVPLFPPGPVHIVGSIGCIFAGLIKHELENNGLKAGQFIKDPTHRLFEIHLGHGRK